MEKLIHFLEDETKKADRRYKSLCKDIETGLEGVGGVDVMLKRAKAAQHEKTYYNFFYELRARFDVDNANDDMPSFITYCLELIQDEFKNYTDKNEALSEARQVLLKKLTPILATAHFDKPYITPEQNEDLVHIVGFRTEDDLNADNREHIDSIPTTEWENDGLTIVEDNEPSFFHIQVTNDDGKLLHSA